MSATLAAAPALRIAGVSDRPSLVRLVQVELRKMTDTRAGFWLLLATAALTVAATVIAALALPAEDRTAVNLVAVAVQPASILLPVVGILLVTSEWTQRTAMITFALVPHRWRILAAKLLAGLTLAVVAFALALAAGLAATAFAGTDGGEGLSAALIGQVGFSVVVPMVAGIAFGAVLLASAPAIVLYYVLPTAFAALGAIPALEGAARWLDQARTMEPLLEEMLSSTQWARVGTSLALWLIVPLVVGFWRVRRSDVR